MMMKVSIMRHHHHHNNNNHADQLKNITIKNNKIKEMMIPPRPINLWKGRKKQLSTNNTPLPLLYIIIIMTFPFQQKYF